MWRALKGVGKYNRLYGWYLQLLLLLLLLLLYSVNHVFIIVAQHAVRRFAQHMLCKFKQRGERMPHTAVLHHDQLLSGPQQVNIYDQQQYYMSQKAQPEYAQLHDNLSTDRGLRYVTCRREGPILKAPLTATTTHCTQLLYCNYLMLQGAARVVVVLLAVSAW
jgi:hypothetical protein